MTSSPGQTHFTTLLLSILSTLAFPILASADCPGAPAAVEKLAADRMTKLSSAFTSDDTKLILFVGLWSRIDERERRKLGGAISGEVSIPKLQAVMGTVATRLNEDRRELASWVSANALGSEIEVQPIPVDGTFLLVRTSRKGLQAMLCASAAGDLPAVLTELGH